MAVYTAVTGGDTRRSDAARTDISGLDATFARIYRLEQIVQELQLRLYSSYVQGRLRTDRPVPTSSSDVQPPDHEYDIVPDTTYQYYLVNISGTLTWVRWAYSTF